MTADELIAILQGYEDCAVSIDTDGEGYLVIDMGSDIRRVSLSTNSTSHPTADLRAGAHEQWTAQLGRMRRRIGELVRALEQARDWMRSSGFVGGVMDIVDATLSDSPSEAGAPLPDCYCGALPMPCPRHQPVEFAREAAPPPSSDAAQECNPLLCPGCDNCTTRTPDGGGK